jgi:leader peptidase (prepilin peptidase)/N-methyltransferase
MIEYLFVFLIGLIFGSFLNVLIHRLPLELSLLKPLRSSCPDCQHKIKWFENIPVVSYILLKRRCSSCHKPISLVYPVVELLTGTVTLMLYMNYWLNFELIVMVTLFYTLIVLSFIDLKHKAVPDFLLIISIVLVLLIGDLVDTLLFAGGFVLLELIMTFYIQTIKSRLTKNKELEKQSALGGGDIPIAGVIGGLVGVQLGISAIFLAALLALLPALYNLFFKKNIEIAFIPYLSLGLFIVLISNFNIFMPY